MIILIFQFSSQIPNLQQEWQIVQRVVKDSRASVTAVEEAISQAFLPSLFDNIFDDGNPRRKLATLPVKFAGLAIPNPITSSHSNHKASTLMCSYLIATLRGNVEFHTYEHKEVIQEVKAELTTRNNARHETVLTALASKLSCNDHRTILQGKATGQWLSVLPSLANGTELSAQEFRDALLFRYARSPPDLPSQCDGCLDKFSVRHALSCKKGGLVISRYNEIQDALSDLAFRALFPSAVHDKPRINSSRPAEVKHATEPIPGVKTLRSNRTNEDRGNILIQGCWAHGMDCIIDVRITDVDAKANRSRAPGNDLAQHKREKKKKYLGPCLEQRRHFTPFVVSTDGLLGKEAKTLLKRLSALLS
jgi:hypothetical protein